MEQELKQQLDRIEAKLDHLLQSVGGTKESSHVLPSKEEIRHYDDQPEGKGAKESTTGIPDLKKNPQQYNEAMKKYDPPDGNR